MAASVVNNRAHNDHSQPRTRPTQYRQTRDPKRSGHQTLSPNKASLVADRRLIICILFDQVVDDGKLKHYGGTRRRSAVGKTKSQDAVAIRFSIPSQISGE